MNTLSSQALRVAALATVAVAAFAGASSAQARDNVQFSVSVGSPGYVQPAPVYVRPAPVYVAPRPVYVAPQPVYVAPPAPYWVDGWGHRHPRHWQHEGRQAYGAYGDRDHDGVPNRFDRAPNNPYRR